MPSSDLPKNDAINKNTDVFHLDKKKKEDIHIVSSLEYLMIFWN